MTDLRGTIQAGMRPPREAGGRSEPDSAAKPWMRRALNLRTQRRRTSGFKRLRMSSHTRVRPEGRIFVRTGLVRMGRTPT